MSIQWFPGHMTKAMRMMEENVKIVDAVGYVLDARAPAACFNPEYPRLVGNKPCLFLLNKCDLADNAATEQWCKHFAQKGLPFVKVTATASAEAGKITAALESLTAPLRSRMQAKGVFKPTRCMILGVPNCGKSTIINCLAGRKTVITGDRPGVTKGKQWVRLKSGLELLDTPGTLWPKFEEQTTAYELCFIGSVKDDVVDILDVAQNLLVRLAQSYPQSLQQRYNTDAAGKDGWQLLQQIAAKRGFLVRGGEIDAERCAKAVLDDFRKGKLGKVTLNLPQL